MANKHDGKEYRYVKRNFAAVKKVASSSNIMSGSESVYLFGVGLDRVY
jgi:hypothetical protein